ncbi:MAG: SpoIID/LytB domain-containing protein [Kofleriaceae bacterium]|nr:SpoIID/LytB domain-containing protein [Kofleriaceae bacterium]
MKRSILLVLALALGGCSQDGFGFREASLDAYCTVMVRNVGIRDIETDYLPRVITCENGGAPLEALKVQAVSARSYLYYKIETSGSVADGTSDQVYTCGTQPGPQHYQAVRETAGQVLRYRNVNVAAFFVAGSRNQPAPSCRGSTDDPTNTERYVTYNEGLSGNNLRQTTLGFVSPTNYRNRGCMSQNGSACLARAGGRDYRQILQFYYGTDIELVQTVGACVAAPDGGSSPADAGPPPSRDAGPVTPRDAGVAVDSGSLVDLGATGTPDLGAPAPTDAGPVATADASGPLGTDAEARTDAARGGSNPISGSCGCSAPGRTAPFAWPLALGLLLPLLRRRARA